MATIEEAFDVVCKTFRISALNAPQKNGITKIVEERRDVFINLPTGFGEERCVTILNDLSEKKKYVFVNLRNNIDTDTGQKKSLKHPRDSHDSYRQC